MNDFRVSTGTAKSSVLILVIYFVVASILAIYILVGHRATPFAAYIVGPTLSFASSSLFYTRKIYLIVFSGKADPGNHSHQLAFLIYVLLRPFFSALIALLFVLALEHLVHAVSYSPKFSEGFVLVSAITGLVLGSITGSAISALTQKGKRMVSSMDGMS